MTYARLASRDVREGLGYTVCRLRQLRGWTQTELGKQAGIDQATVSNIEAASEEVGLSAILAVANALEVPVHVLFLHPPLPLGKRELRIDKRGKG